MRLCVTLLAAGCATGMGPGGEPNDATTSPDASLDSLSPDSSAVDAPPGIDGPPDVAVATAAFLLDELNPNITGSVDLIELLATQGGTASGIKIQEGISSPVTLVTLPALTVAAGDLVVVHLNPPAGVTGEIGSKTDCTDPACYAGAWDVRGGTSGLTFSNRVLLVKGADGSIQDAVPFIRTNLSTPPAAFPGDLQTIQTMGLWLPANCGGAPCTYTSTPTAQAISADWTTVGNTATGASIHRVATAKMASDWVVGAQTFGSAN